MSYLDDRQLQEFKDLLAQREAQLQEEVRTVEGAMIPPAEVPRREAEETVETAEERVLSGLDHVQLLRDQEELIEIDAARGRPRLGILASSVESDDP